MTTGLFPYDTLSGGEAPTLTLAEHRKRMLAEGHCASDRPVFCDTDGGYLRLSNLHKNSFKPILARAGLPPIRLDDLRHDVAAGGRAR
jgi:hypothetical protein